LSRIFSTAGFMTFDDWNGAWYYVKSI